MKKIEPRTNHVIVECFKSDKIGGIIVPESAQKKSDYKWVVVCVGPDVEGLKKGDQIMFDARSCIPVVAKDVPENYFVVLAENVNGIIK